MANMACNIIYIRMVLNNKTIFLKAGDKGDESMPLSCHVFIIKIVGQIIFFSIYFVNQVDEIKKNKIKISRKFSVTNTPKLKDYIISNCSKNYFNCR